VKSLEPTTRLPVTRVAGRLRETVDDEVVREEPLTIFVGDEELVTLLASPSDLEDLVLGFLFTEGLIRDAAGVARLEIDAERGEAWVDLVDGVVASRLFGRRAITSGCGAAGRSRQALYRAIDVLQLGVIPGAGSRRAEPPPPTPPPPPSPDTIFALAHLLQTGGEIFRRTGGVHSAALAFDETLACLREDIGRHNAVDKVAGWALAQAAAAGVPPRDYLRRAILLTTGRLSSEIVIKAARAGIGVVVSRSAPTALAVEISGLLGVVLIGFARGQRFTIY
jgi:FdhD protein